MKLRSGIFPLLAMIFCISACTGSNPDQAKTDATAAAKGWLATIDQGGYEQAWNSADDAIKRAGTAAQFGAMMKKRRAPFGAVKTRNAASTQYQQNPENAPPGEYVALVFEDAFANGQSAQETIVLRRESDGSWKVGQYQIE